MRGEPDSCGIWAACLTHADGKFWLIYTDVKRYGKTSGAGGAPGASPRDMHNYLVTCDTIDGVWSEPIHLNSSGFDPSLFHDDDGRKYLVNMLWDHRPGANRFGGIVLQEYSVSEQKLIGERLNIFKGTDIGLTEAPHLYKREGWYYLLTAEGGTGWGHAVTMARALSINGPYDLHPDTYVLTARDRPDSPLQRAGHADLVDTPSGETWMAYLCGRPIPNRGRCTLGRETAIQPMVWGEDGWLRTRAGDAMPELVPEMQIPRLASHERTDIMPITAPIGARSVPNVIPSDARSAHDVIPSDARSAESRNQHLTSSRSDFDDATLPIDFQWLRTPFPDELFTLTDRPGHLRLFGRESMGSFFRQSLVARRLQSHCASVSTVLEFAPEHYQQSAGLVCYYNAAKFHYLHVSRDEEGRYLRAMSSIPDGVQTDAFTTRIELPDTGRVELRAEIDFERLRFGYRVDVDQEWQWLPEVLDASILSDEAAAPGTPNFTGAFVGVACQDLAGTACAADFDWFEYEGREYQVDPSL
jgi:xylan 1,4-beta-xylosidase